MLKYFGYSTLYNANVHRSTMPILQQNKTKQNKTNKQKNKTKQNKQANKQTKEMK